MTKQEFLASLREGLRGLPPADVEERIAFYDEMIDDRMEEGLTEEEALEELGSVESVIAQIAAETPLVKLVKEKVKQRRGLKAWEIVLLVLGSPVWLPLGIAAFAVCLSLYVVLWAVLVCFWAVDLALAVSALGGIAAAVFFAIKGNLAGAGVMLGAAILCAGLAILVFFGCRALTKGLLWLTKKMLLGIKSLFIGKETSKK